MARFGIGGKNVLGGPNIPTLRKIAKEIKKEAKTTNLNIHSLAQELWDSEIHEARILAGFIDDPTKVSEKQMEAWVKDFDSWDLCDQVCMNLFDKTSFVYQKIDEWSKKDKEFIKRAAFALMATLAVHDKNSPDEKFLKFLPIIKRESIDERNFVKKAVNWALRQIGKRNADLNKTAIKTAQEIQRINSKSARWIAADALKELTTHFK